MKGANPLVLTQIRQKWATAAVAVAKLEAQLRTAPIQTGATWTRANVSKKLSEATWQRDSWADVISMIELKTDVDPDAPVDFVPAEESAPGRIVARMAYVEDGPNHLICNRNRGCQQHFPTGTDFVAVASEDLPEGGICQVCGTDVLA